MHSIWLAKILIIHIFRFFYVAFGNVVIMKWQCITPTYKCDYTDDIIMKFQSCIYKNNNDIYDWPIIVIQDYLLLQFTRYTSCEADPFIIKMVLIKSQS